MNTEKENMMRTLADKPRLASAWCSIGIHRWQRWRSYKEDIIETDKLGYSVIQQLRECDDCGLKQLSYTNASHKKIT